MMHLARLARRPLPSPRRPLPPNRRRPAPPGRLARIGRLLVACAIVWSVAIVVVSAPASAHPGEEEALRLVLLDWANGIANANAEQIGRLLADDFVHESYFTAPADHDRYLALVATGAAPMQKIDLRHVRYAVTGDRARADDVLGVVMQTTAVAAEAAFVRSEAGWKLARVAQKLVLPDFARPFEPEQVRLETVGLRILDAASGKPVAARIHVEDEQGRTWAPEGHVAAIPTGWRESVGKDVRVAGKTWAYVPGETRIALPAGRHTIEVERGFETIAARQRFEVRADEPNALEIRLARWSDVRSRGWHSGDTHVHFVDPEAARLELEGEDLDVLNILASKWGALITNVEHFTGAPSGSSPPGRAVFVGEETRHVWLGHSILLGIERLVYPLTWGGPSEGVPGGFDHPPMATQADAAHAQGGLVTAAHFPYPKGELAVDVALDKLDAVDVLTWGDAFSEKNVMPAPPSALTWYRFLNCGFDLPATAGTDKMDNTQVSGSVRVYAKVDGPFSYDAWLEAIRAGRTFVSTAPLLEFTVEGALPGTTLDLARGAKVLVRAVSRSRVPIERLELVRDGRVVATVRNPQKEVEVVLDRAIRFDESGWIAVRAYSPELLPYQAFPLVGFDGIPVMAHSSPVYVRVDGQPRRSPDDASVLLGWVREAIAWARNEARFQRPEEKAAMLALFARAERVYLDQIGETPSASTSEAATTTTTTTTTQKKKTKE
ncbi:MAG: CehA/McbA family metallohydrolase [Myxococcota bacterium]